MPTTDKPHPIHHYFLTEDEAHILQTILHKNIKGIYKDAFLSILIIFEDSGLWITSSPEIGYAWDENKEPQEIEIMRISVRKISYSEVEKLPIAEDEFMHCSEIESIQIANGVLLFSVPEILPPTNFGNIQIDRPGKGYSYRLLNPYMNSAIHKDISKLAKEKIVNQIDVGLLLKCKEGEELLIWTNGVSYGIEFEESLPNNFDEMASLTSLDQRIEEIQKFRPRAGLY